MGPLKGVTSETAERKLIIEYIIFFCTYYSLVNIAAYDIVLVKVEVWGQHGETHPPLFFAVQNRFNQIKSNQMKLNNNWSKLINVQFGSNRKSIILHVYIL